MARLKTTNPVRDRGATEEEAPVDEIGSEGSGSDDFQEDPPVRPAKPSVDPPKGVFFASVNIDHRTFNVNYGNEENFLRLLRECALEAATKIPRPNAKGRFFFRCVHCLSTAFTSKTRLNKHRWDSECPAVKDDMGNPKRLLPYPAQGNGQGKTSEMIRKGKDAEVTTKLVSRLRSKNKKSDTTPQDSNVQSSVPFHGDSEHPNATEVNQEVRGAIGDSQPEQPQKSTSSVPVAEAGENIEVQDVIDIAPIAEENVADGAGISDTSYHSKLIDQDMGEGMQSIDEQARQRNAVEEEGRPIEECIADRTKRRRSGEHATVEDGFWQNRPRGVKAILEKAPEAKHSLNSDAQAAQPRPEQRVSAKTAISKPKMKAVRENEPSVPAGALNVSGQDNSSDDLSFRYLVQSRTKSPLGLQGDQGLQSIATEKESMFEEMLVTEATDVTDVPPHNVSVPPLQSPELPVSDSVKATISRLKTLAAQRGFLKRSPEREIAARALEELHREKRTKLPQSPSPRRKLLRLTVLSSDSEEQQQVMATTNRMEAQDPWSPDPAEARQTLGPMLDERREEFNNDVDAYADDLQAQVEGGEMEREPMEETPKHAVTSPHSNVDLQGSPDCVPSTSPPELVTVSSLDVVPWTGNFQGNLAMQRYWMCGLGSPEPIVHPGVAQRNPARVERLDKDEQDVRIKAGVKADAMAALSPKPKTPEPCPIPDLFYLVQVRPQLLNWDYRGQSAEEFRKSFSSFWETGLFQESTRACSMWWFCEAKEEDYPDVSNAIGRAVTSICRSVKYKEMPPAVDLFAKYLQYLRDVQSYEASLAELRLRQERIVEEAVQAFRHDTEFRRESYRWDWCPLWWVVSQVNVFRKLPPLPWRHDDEEAEEVRRILLAKRVPRMSPPHFVKVLRIAMNSIFGRFRQFTCPIFGVNRATLRAICSTESQVLRAIGIYTTEGPFRFAGIHSWQPQEVHDSVMSDAQLVCQGKEDRVLDGVMEWVESVRARALQDLALHHPAVFRTCWRTTTREHWGEQSQTWATCLRIREDLDIGWVAEVHQPDWAIRVKGIQQQIVHLVQSLDTATEEDDEAAWASRLVYPAPSGETVHCPALPMKVTSKSSVGDDSVSAEGPLPLEQPGKGVDFSVNVDDICTQDLEIDGLSVPVTPPTLVGMVSTQSGGCASTVDVIRASPRSLEQVFRTISCTPEAALEDDNDSDREPEKVANVMEATRTVDDVEWATIVRHAKSVTFVPVHVKDEDLKRWGKLSVPKTYDLFTLDELVEALPRKGGGDVDMGTVNFFGDPKWDALPVPVSQIQDLRRSKRFLGQNIVELLSRRLWWSLSAQARERVYVAPSFMQVPLQHAWDAQSDEALLKWGREYLVPSRFYQTCPPDMEVLVPYVGGLHWSLIILTSTQVLHLDSGGMHDFAEDLEYIKRLRKVWELLHNPILTLPPTQEKVKCFKQIGNSECGYCVLRFMESFLRIFHGDNPVLDTVKADAMFYEQVKTPESGRELQKNVIAAIADELGAGGDIELYDSPYRVTYAPHRESSPEIVKECKKGNK